MSGDGAGHGPYFASDKPERCPNCGKTRVVKIAYGMPASELFEAAERGEVALGGCCINEFDPSWTCLDCEAEIFREELRGPMQEQGWGGPPAFSAD